MTADDPIADIDFIGAVGKASMMGHIDTIFAAQLVLRKCAA